MRRHVQFAVFAGTFITLSLVLNYYIFSHLTYLLDLDLGGWFWVLLVLSSSSWFLSMGLGMRFSNGPARVLVFASGTWLGMLFVFLFTLIAYDVTRVLVMPLEREAAAPVIVAFALAVSIGGVVNAQLLRVRDHVVPSRKLEGELRVVHLSDLHVGSIHGKRYLERIVEKVNEARPDMVLITGDLADGPHAYDDGAFSPLDAIEAPVFLTTGNHEHYAGLDEVLRVIGNTKVRVLRNEAMVEDGVRIVGIDDSWDRDAVARGLEGLELDDGRYTILMYHRPVGVEAASEAGVDLMLSGHTHAGQFYPFNLLVRAIWKKVRGLYPVGDMYLHASPGTGTWGPPMRIGTSSEITLLRVNGE